MGLIQIILCISKPNKGDNMTNVIIGVIVVLAIAFGLYTVAKKVKGNGGCCCGSHSDKPENDDNDEGCC